MGKTTKSRHFEHPKWFQNNISRFSILTLIFICLYAVSMYVPIIGGFTAYPIAIMKCGQLPVVTSNFMGVYDYTIPSTKGYQGATILSTMKNYVCTPHDAEKQGYHKAILQQTVL